MPCSLDDLKAEFDRKLAAMSDEELVTAFAEIGCDVEITNRENVKAHTQKERVRRSENTENK